MPRTRNYSVDQLTKAVRESYSFAQVLSKLGLKPAGGNYKILKQRLHADEIDYSHFTHSSWSKGKTVGPRRELEEYLTYPAKYQLSSHKLKLRLIREGVFQHRCTLCDNTEWQGQAIPLELDHINGDNTDNRLENLRLLCPNCHALTPTYRGKNRAF